MGGTQMNSAMHNCRDLRIPEKAVLFFRQSKGLGRSPSAISEGRSLLHNNAPVVENSPTLQGSTSKARARGHAPADASHAMPGRSTNQLAPRCSWEKSREGAAVTTVPFTQPSIAANRFGFGARPGELAAAGNDPRGWLLAQLDGPYQSSTELNGLASGRDI